MNKENPPTQIITEQIPEPFVKKLDDFRSQIGKDLYTNDVVVPGESEKYYWEVETTQLGPKETDEYLEANRLNDPELIIVKAAITVVRLKAKDGYELSKDQRREWCFIVDTIARDPSFDLERPFDPGPTNNEPIYADVLAKNGTCEVGVDPNAPIDQKLSSQIIAVFRSKPDANGKVNRFFITRPEIKAINAYGPNPNWTPDGELFIGGKEPHINSNFRSHAKLFGPQDPRNSVRIMVEMVADYNPTSPHFLVSPSEYYTKTPPGYKAPIKDYYDAPQIDPSGPMYTKVSYEFDYLEDYNNCFAQKTDQSAKPSEPATPSPSAKPSKPATATPSAKPSESATPSPSAKPSESAIATPSAKPSKPATPTPSAKPSKPATPTPSVKPTETPVPNPSAKPSDKTQKSYRCESTTGIKDCDAYYPDSLKKKMVTEPIPLPQLNTSLDAVKDLDDKGEYKNEVVVPKDGEGYYFDVKDYEIDPKALEFKSKSHKDVYEGVETKEARVVKVTLKTRSGFELPASQRREWCFVTEKFKKTPPPPEPTPEAPETTPEVTPEPTPEAPKTTPEVTPEPKMSPTPEPEVTPSVSPSTNVSSSQSGSPSSPTVKKRGLPTTGAAGGVGLFALSAISGAALVLRLRRKE